MKLASISENDFRLKELMPGTSTTTASPTPQKTMPTMGSAQDPNTQQALGAKQVVDAQARRKEIQDQIRAKKVEMTQMRQQTQSEIRDLQQQLSQLT